MQMTTKSILFLFVFLFVYSVSNSQDGTRSIGYSTRAIGRGGTEIGFFDSPSLMLTNPGGLSFITSSMLAANGIFMIPPPKFKNYKNVNGVTNTTILNDAEGEKNLYVLPSLSYIHKLNKSKFTLGAGAITSGGMGADFMLNHELFKDASGNYVQQKYHSRFAIIESGISIAYLITPEFSAGISGEFVYSQLEFTNPFSLSPTVMKGQATPTMTFGQMFAAPRSYGGLNYKEVTSSAEMKGLKSYTFSGKAGIAYKFNDGFSIGASYSAAIPLRFKNGTSTLDMTAQFTDASGRAVQNVMARYPEITVQAAKDSVTRSFLQMGIDATKGFVSAYDIENSFEAPQSFGIGLMYSPIPKLKFGLDFEWINWSKSFDKMTLTLRNGTNANINKMLAAGGTGQADLIIDFLLNWKDAVILKFGGEYEFSDKFTVRLGYAYGSNPIPTTTIIPIIPAILEHHFMGGFSYYITKNFVTNVAFEYGLNHTLTASNPSLIAAEYNNSQASLKNLLGHISFAYIFK
jgi:long-subunit fatty acid transport protein